MDMELQRTQLGGWRPIYDTVIRQEETLESIVPDAMPDMVRIIRTGATALLRQKEAAESTARVTGTIRTTILYTPEGGGEPCALEVNIPFLISLDHASIHGECPILARLQVIGADAQMLNPRKVLVRAEITAGIVAYGEERREVTTGVRCGDDSLQMLREERKDYSAADIMGKAFTFSDVLRIPPSRPTPEKLLCSRVRCGAAEAKVIGKKLVAKGQMELTSLYWAGGVLSAVRHELPFSQVIDTRFDGEECTAAADVLLTGMNCRLREDGDLEVTLDLMLQAVVEYERVLMLMTDVYSTAGPLLAQREEIPLTLLRDHGELRQLARQMCPSAIGVKQVLDSTLTVGEVTQLPAGEGKVTATANAYADILFVSEEDELFAAAYTIPVGCELSVPTGCKCECICGMGGEMTAVPVSDGVEVRFEAVFSYRVMRPYSVSAVSSAQPGSEPESGVSRPSVVVRKITEGERLWDVAKECGSTVSAIRAANAMGGEEAVCGAVLLIPRSR